LIKKVDAERYKQLLTGSPSYLSSILVHVKASKEEKEVQACKEEGM
jgi:hypothetical protein